MWWAPWLVECNKCRHIIKKTRAIIAYEVTTKPEMIKYYYCNLCRKYDTLRISGVLFTKFKRDHSRGGYGWLQ